MLVIDSQPAWAHYVIIRSDLPLGHTAAQITHAAGESSSGNLPLGTIAVVLGVSSEQELLQEQDNLATMGIEFCSIREPDPPYNGQLMAIGIKPMPRDKIQPFLKHLELLGKETRAG